jgi:protein-ribulosamine 3-kinase
VRFLESALARALDTPDVRIQRATSLSGGCIHEARRLVTNRGEFFAKWSDSAPSDLFVAEAEGLKALAKAGSGLVIPKVIAAAASSSAHPGYLILEYLEPVTSSVVEEEALGRGLATVHRARADKFGFDRSTFCGSTRQDNTRSASWPEFYGTRRLAPLVATLRERGLSPERVADYQRLIDRLPDWLLSEPSPSLIHGDLWSGNVLGTSRGPALVDPACAYADREMEFGITLLFGGLSARAFDAYEEEWPLLHGWRDRNALYRIYHLLNHAVLFGGGYEGQALELTRRYTG